MSSGKLIQPKHQPNERQPLVTAHRPLPTVHCPLPTAYRLPPPAPSPLQDPIERAAADFFEG